MKRRDTLKAISLSSFGLAVAPESVVTDTKKEKGFKPAPGRTEEEIQRDKLLMQQVFFTPEELKTIQVLCDIIIPADEVSGSASQAGVPAFIEFMAKDQPSYQTPLRGGIKWLDNFSVKTFGKSFVQLSNKQQIEIVELIAYPQEATPEVSQGVAFFSRMRDLTISGFYTTPMGFQDVGYMGNQPNNWDGVPQEVLDKYQLSYDPLYFQKEEEE
ncbi:MAG: gluconate 2-dehydrogenase subunit 3 family protein [Spirosomataceae bacterium]